MITIIRIRLNNNDSYYYYYTYTNLTTLESDVLYLLILSMQPLILYRARALHAKECSTHITVCTHEVQSSQTVHHTVHMVYNTVHIVYNTVHRLHTTLYTVYKYKYNCAST